MRFDVKGSNGWCKISTAIYLLTGTTEGKLFKSDQFKIHYSMSMFSPLVTKMLELCTASREHSNEHIYVFHYYSEL
jgi:hypothetical protein